jgi:hypothetical protein
MPEKLLEYDFVTDDFSSIFEDTSTSKAAHNNSANGEVKPVTHNWSKDLKDRLETNKQLSPKSRKSLYELETEFFTEFFDWFFKDTELTRQAMRVGGELQKDIKIFGFNRKKNPILGFLYTSHVRTKILKPGLLNASTYRAIRKSVIDNSIADSEFFKANDYDIIYCADLYKKKEAEMTEYIKQQSLILKPSAAEYTVDDLAKNKKAFFYIKTIKELDINKRIAKVYTEPNDKLPAATNANTKLNSLDFVESFTEHKEETGRGTTNTGGTKRTTNISAITNKLLSAKSPAPAFAVIQYLGVANRLPEAQQALAQPVFSRLTAKEIATATTKVAQLLDKLTLSEKAAKELIDSILDGLS